MCKIDILVQKMLISKLKIFGIFINIFLLRVIIVFYLKLGNEYSNKYLCVELNFNIRRNYKDILRALKEII